MEKELPKMHLVRFKDNWCIFDCLDLVWSVGGSRRSWLSAIDNWYAMYKVHPGNTNLTVSYELEIGTMKEKMWYVESIRERWKRNERRPDEDVRPGREAEDSKRRASEEGISGED